MDIDTVFDQIAAKRIEVKRIERALNRAKFGLADLESRVDTWRYEQVMRRMVNGIEPCQRPGCEQPKASHDIRGGRCPFMLGAYLDQA